MTGEQPALPEEEPYLMIAHALTLPRIATGGPKFDRDRLSRIARDWWQECREILNRACPVVPVPSPVRELLARA
jgi:hypothetical protein